MAEIYYPGYYYTRDDFIDLGLWYSDIPVPCKWTKFLEPISVPDDVFDPASQVCGWEVNLGASER